MAPRRGKQCRERWNNHLRPDINRGKWSAREDTHFLKLHQIYGNKWSSISRNMRGRTENSVKNHWYEQRPNSHSRHSPRSDFLLTFSNRNATKRKVFKRVSKKNPCKAPSSSLEAYILSWYENAPFPDIEMSLSTTFEAKEEHSVPENDNSSASDKSICFEEDAPDTYLIPYRLNGHAAEVNELLMSNSDELNCPACFDLIDVSPPCKSSSAMETVKTQDESGLCTFFPSKGPLVREIEPPQTVGMEGALLKFLSSDSAFFFEYNDEFRSLEEFEERFRTHCSDKIGEKTTFYTSDESNAIGLDSLSERDELEEKLRSAFNSLSIGQALIALHVHASPTGLCVICKASRKSDTLIPIATMKNVFFSGHEGL